MTTVLTTGGGGGILRCPRLIIGRMIDPQSDMVAWLAGQDEPTVILLSGGRVGASVLELKSRGRAWRRLAVRR